MCKFNTIILLFLSFNTFAQKQVAITIDDAPNTRLGTSMLLQRIDSLQLPTAIFINEDKLNHHGSYEDNLVLLESWIANPLITPAHHSYSHKRSSVSSVEVYTSEIENGEKETRVLAKKYDKELNQFRFPYNDLGRDSLQQDSLKQVLTSKGYNITPFTIESSDWMFNAVYKKYMEQHESEKAHEIGNLYVQFTLQRFDFYDSVGWAHYNRNVKQIYLCHDNELNRDYLHKIADQLNNQEYQFITLEDALTDPIYSQKDYFYKKYGISWFYRWIANVEKRNQLGRAEPVCERINNEFEGIK